MAAESNNPPQPPSQAGTDTAPRKPDPICAVIARTRHDMIHAEVMEAARRNVMLAELRLDYLAKAADFGRLLAEKPLPLLATVRRREDGGRFKGTEQERRMLLRQAIVAGFDWVDIEEDIIQSVPRYGKTKRIVSYHNFKEVPADLHGLFRRMHEADADIIKIACMPQQIEDVARVLDLLRFTKKPTIALCMGDMGLPSRVIQGALGAPFTYAAINPERLPAPGMLTVGQLQNIYGVRRLNKETKIFGVVGDPIGHSLSPIVHNIGFRKLGINALYLPFKVPEGKLSNFLASHSALKIQGLSVTIPHKESAVHQATELEPLVAQTQSANTLVRTASGFKALNTDRPAILDSLVAGLPANPDGTPGTLNQKLALVLGAGGVARSVAHALIGAGAFVTITNRTDEKAQKLAAEMNCRQVDWGMRLGTLCDILVNCTSCGMYPEVDESPMHRSSFHSGMVVMDTIYNPENTMLIKHAREHGATVVTGLDMFIRQAAAQFREFVGQEPPLDLMRQVAKNALTPISVRKDNRPAEEKEEAKEKEEPSGEGTADKAGGASA
jgi:3-dehydroquinate dehydratase/shikimate dehydrogenase